MDRLICGDVGFGKTEVALRAALATVMNGKQVAVVVPTTLLARQLAKTFTERFRGFPVHVAQASRLIAAPQLAKTKKGLAEGAIFAEFNTFAGANKLNSSTVVNYPILRTESGDVHALHNVVQQASTAGAGARKVVQDELVLNWRSTAAAPTRPGDRLTGPFSQDGAGRWIYPTLLSDGSYTKPAFVAAMRGLLVATSGAAGIVT